MHIYLLCATGNLVKINYVIVAWISVVMYILVIICVNTFYLPSGTGDIETPPVRPSVTFCFRTVTLIHIALFSRNFAGICTMSRGCAV